jgi:hypothetical protein
MSANVSTNNLSVSGTCGVSGTVGLSSALISGSTASFQGVSTTALTTTGEVLHNVLPICNVLPVVSGELTNKAYVNSENAIQDTRIGALEVKTTNLSFSANRTTLAGVSTVGGVMTHSVPPVSATLPTSANQVSNKQYVDNNIQIVNNSILVTNNAATVLSNRVGNTETKLTNVSYASGSNTTSISGATAFLNAPTISATSTATNSVQTKAYIDAQDLIATNSITALQTENNTQTSDIFVLQEKTSAIVYSNPPTGQLTEISSSVSLLPYGASTIMKAYTVSCQALISLGQSTFGGVGFTTARAQFGGFGTPIQTVYYGSSTSVNGTNTVTFATPMTGTFPKILLTAIGTSSVVLSNKTLAGFNYTATGVFNVDWIAIQPL